MDFIVNGNKRIIIEVKKIRKEPVLKKENISLYSKNLYKLQAGSGRK